MDLPTPADTFCDAGGVREILSRIGDKWTMQVVVSLRDQPRRFNDIKRQVAGISQQMLTRSLKALERDGMLTRTVVDTNPPQVEYALTRLGLSMAEPVRQLAQWAGDHLPVIRENRQRYDADHPSSDEAGV